MRLQLRKDFKIGLVEGKILMDYSKLAADWDDTILVVRDLVYNPIYDTHGIHGIVASRLDLIRDQISQVYLPLKDAITLQERDQFKLQLEKLGVEL